jgi:hypothetical protein
MLTIEIDHEEDGRWIGEVPETPGVLVYGATEGRSPKQGRGAFPLCYRRSNRTWRTGSN